MKRAATGSKPAGKSHNAKAPTIQTLPDKPQDIAEKPSKKTTASKDIPLDALIRYREQHLSYAEIGAIVGCSEQNVQQRLSDFNLEGFESYKKDPSLSLERFCYRFISLIEDGQIKNMIDRRGMTDFGIALDKVREIRGQNDSNIKPMILIVKGDAQVQVNQQAGPKVDRAVDNPIHQPPDLIPSELCKPR